MWVIPKIIASFIFFIYGNLWAKLVFFTNHSQISLFSSFWLPPLKVKSSFFTPLVTFTYTGYSHQSNSFVTVFFHIILFPCWVVKCVVNRQKPIWSGSFKTVCGWQTLSCLVGSRDVLSLIGSCSKIHHPFIIGGITRWALSPEVQTQFVWLSIIAPWTLECLEASRCRGPSVGMDAAAGGGSCLLNTIKIVRFSGCNRKYRCPMTGRLWVFFLPTIRKTYIESSDISFFPPGFCWRGLKGCFKCTSILKTGKAGLPAWC